MSDVKRVLTRISVRLPDQQIDYLNAEAERLGLTVSEVLRRLIDDARGAGLTKAAPNSSARTTRTKK